MANTQKENLNNRQVKIKSDLEFGVINPLVYNKNTKTFSLNIDSKDLMIDDGGRLAIVQKEIIEGDWDINWNANNMPQNEGWIRYTSGCTINEEEISTDGTGKYLRTNISSDNASNLIYNYNANFNITDGFVAIIRAEVVSLTNTSVSIYRLDYSTTTISPPNNKNYIRIILNADNTCTLIGSGWTSEVVPISSYIGVHNWRIIGYTNGGKEYIQIWCDGLIIAAREVSDYTSIETENISFGNSIVDNSAGMNTIVNFYFVRVKTEISIVFSIILDTTGAIIGGDGYEWVLDYLIVNHNVSILENMAINGTLNVIGATTLNASLNGILKATAGLVSGSANLDDLFDIVITSVQDNDILQYDSATSKWINAVANSNIYITSAICDSGVSVKDLVYVDATGVWQKAIGSSNTTKAQGVVTSKIDATHAVILTKGIYGDFTTGMTASTLYYLSTVSAGGLLTTFPDLSTGTTGYLVQIVGFADNATDMFFDFSEGVQL